MTGALACQRLADPTPDGSRFAFELEVSRHAFLRDHRVGSSTLLSTVMGIEAMGSAAAELRPARPVVELVAVSVDPPLWVPDASAIRADVDLIDVDGERLEAAVTSVEPGTGAGRARPGTSRQRHFRATLRLGDRVPGPGSSLWAPPFTVGAVSGRDVYRLFFHGPSFQVIGSVSLHSDTMVSRLATDLAPIAEPSGRSACSPRLIELALQTAGLFEIAHTGAMTIPSAIGRISLWSGTAEATSGRAMTARVSRRVAPDGHVVYDAQVVDDRGTTAVSIEGYRTVAMHGPFDADELAALRSKLLSSAHVRT